MSSSVAALIVAAVFLLLGFHCLRTRGRIQTALLFGAGLLYSYLRELHITHQPQAMYSGTGALILGVPVLILLGWVVHFYLALWVAQVVLRVPLGQEPNRIISLTIASAAAMLIFSLAGEPIGSALGWWVWHRGNVLNLFWFLGIPINVLGGWMLTGALFVNTFLVFVHRLSIRWLCVLALVLSVRYFTLTCPKCWVGVALLATYFSFLSYYLLRRTAPGARPIGGGERTPSALASTTDESGR